MSVWIAFHPHLPGCSEDALNPVQVVVGGTHTHTHRERLAPHAVFYLPLSHVLQHTEGPALCKIGGTGGGGRALLGWHWLKRLSITRTVLALFFLPFFLIPQPCFPFSAP